MAFKKKVVKRRLSSSAGASFCKRQSPLLPRSIYVACVDPSHTKDTFGLMMGYLLPAERALACVVSPSWRKGIGPKYDTKRDDKYPNTREAHALFRMEAYVDAWMDLSAKRIPKLLRLKPMARTPLSRAMHWLTNLEASNKLHNANLWIKVRAGMIARKKKRTRILFFRRVRKHLRRLGK